MIRRSSILAKYMYLVGAQVLENGAEFEAERRTLGSHWEVREDSILGSCSWEGSRSRTGLPSLPLRLDGDVLNGEP